MSASRCIDDALSETQQDQNLLRSQDYKKSLWFSREQLPSPRGTGSGLLSPPRLSPGGVLRAGLCSAPRDGAAAVLLAQRPSPMVEVGLVSRCLWETSAGLSRGKVKGERGHCLRKGEVTGGPASTRACSPARLERRGADGEQESVHLAVHGWNLWAKFKALSHQDSTAPQTGAGREPALSLRPRRAHRFGLPRGPQLLVGSWPCTCTA